MAKYTIELREIVENGRNIFPFAYEFYDESKRAKFERDFIRHFYFREIGVETVDRFILNLEDKMNTVFPVYNAMLKASQIEYKVLDNYYLSETTKRTVESKGKSSGVSSTVGQTFDEQQTDTTGETNSTSETIGTGKETKNETGTSETTTSETVDSETTNNSTVEGSSEKTGSGSSTSEQNVNKKFLDTPQGLTDLIDSKYLTSLNQDKSSGSTETESTETATDNQTTTGTGTTDTKTDGSSSTDTTANGETNTESNSETTVKDTNTGNVSFKGEQKTTADNNTRTQNDNKSTEETEIIHAGNIGVESDAVMIQKHLKLQQLIAKTFQMFFDECEDLFMMVY